MNLSTRRTALGVIAAAVSVTLAACGGTTSTAGLTTTSAAASTTMPTTATSGSAATAGSSSAGDHNDADVLFAQQMIVHHQGAIAMAEVAATRAGNQQVKDLAATIKAAQAPEIEKMTGWLQDWAPETDLNGMPMTTQMSSSMLSSSAMMSSSMGIGGMDHGDVSGTVHRGSTSGSAGESDNFMPGMMTDPELANLTDATGAAFDKLFLQMMIAHHQDAIEMADTELAQGRSPDAKTLAQTVTTSQTQEIATMQQLLATL